MNRRAGLMGFRFCPRCEGKDVRGSFMAGATSAISCGACRHFKPPSRPGTILEEQSYLWTTCSLPSTSSASQTGNLLTSSEASSRCELRTGMVLLQKQDHAGQLKERDGALCPSEEGGRWMNCLPCGENAVGGQASVVEFRRQ